MWLWHALWITIYEREGELPAWRKWKQVRFLYESGSYILKIYVIGTPTISLSVTSFPWKPLHFGGYKRDRGADRGTNNVCFQNVGNSFFLLIALSMPSPPSRERRIATPLVDGLANLNASDLNLYWCRNLKWNSLHCHRCDSIILTVTGR